MRVGYGCDPSPCALVWSPLKGKSCLWERFSGRDVCLGAQLARARAPCPSVPTHFPARGPQFSGVRL